MTFSIHHVLRQLSGELLKDYLARKGMDRLQDVWKPSIKQRTSAIYGRLVEVDDEVSRSISADLARIHPLSTERGRNALIGAASGDTSFKERLACLENDFERSLWVLANHLKIFESAEALHFFDYYSEGSRGQHYRALPGLKVDTSTEAIRAFSDVVREFYRRRDGSGVSCHVDCFDRGQEGGTQLTIFVQGLPSNSSQFVNGKFRRTMSYPAVEAAIVYESEIGNVTTVAKGGKEVHGALRDAFAEHLLKVDPRYERITARRFQLDALKTNPALTVDADLGVRAVRVRKLKLAPSNLGGILIVEAPGADCMVGVYELGNQWFAEQSHLYEKFRVIQATISIHFQPRVDERKSKTINLELTVPNGSNLKSLKDADRQIAEAHIEMWKLIEPAV